MNIKKNFILTLIILTMLMHTKLAQSAVNDKHLLKLALNNPIAKALPATDPIPQNPALNYFNDKYNNKNVIIKNKVKSEIFYCYDINTQDIISNKNVSAFSGHSTREIEYDNNYNLIKVSTEYSPLHGKKVTFVQNYIYDKSNNLIERKNDKKYEYNKDNKLVKIYDDNGNSNFEVNFVYNENNRLIEKNENGKKLFEYKYDSMNNLIEKIGYEKTPVTYFGDALFPISGTSLNTTTYKYNDKNKLIKLIENKGGKIINEQSFKYDVIGNLTEWTNKNKDSGTKTIFKYSEKTVEIFCLDIATNKLTEKEAAIKKGNDYELISYDANGKEILKQLFTLNDENLILVEQTTNCGYLPCQTTNKYDDNGLKIETVKYSLPSGKIMSYGKYLYKFY